MNEQELIAFELGYDTAMYGQVVPDDATLLFCDGYRTGRKQYPYPQRSDRYILKWLQIRTGALRRGKRVDSAITADYIQKIDVDRCPVTRGPLTHSTTTGTDWSIDRCNNDRGYVPGNLVVMSTQANAAKSDLPFDEIVARGECDAATDGLTPAEWQRMTAVIAPAERLAHGEPPAQFLLGAPFVPGQPYGLPAQVQAALLSAVFTYRDEDEVDERINVIHSLCLCRKEARRAYDRLMQDMFQRMIRQRRSWDYWGLKRPLRLFIEFWVNLTPAMRSEIGLDIGFVPMGRDSINPIRPAGGIGLRVH